MTLAHQSSAAQRLAEGLYQARRRDYRERLGCQGWLQHGQREDRQIRRRHARVQCGIFGRSGHAGSSRAVTVRMEWRAGFSLALQFLHLLRLGWARWWHRLQPVTAAAVISLAL